MALHTHCILAMTRSRTQVCTVSVEAWIVITPQDQAQQRLGTRIISAKRMYMLHPVYKPGGQCRRSRTRVSTVLVSKISQTLDTELLSQHQCPRLVPAQKIEF